MYYVRISQQPIYSTILHLKRNVDSVIKTFRFPGALSQLGQPQGALQPIVLT